MLRWRPSELTLTPADVEETCRRMARRQAPKQPQSLLGGPTRAQVRPVPAARVRRGPERSRDDAVSDLGDMPILLPQHAVHASVADDPVDFDDERTEFGDQAVEDSRREPLDPSASDERPIPGRDNSPRSRVGTLHLPFRPTSTREGDARSGLRGGDGVDPVVHRTSSPPKHQRGSSSFGSRAANISEDVDQDAPSPRRPPTTGSAEFITPGSHDTTDYVRSGRPHNDYNLSPLNRTQTMSSSRQRETPRGRTAEHQIRQERTPTRYLQGYWLTPEQYTFKEVLPRTEPRQRTERHTPLIRPMSASSDPTHRPPVQRPNHLEASTADDDFWSTPAPERPSQLHQNTNFFETHEHPRQSHASNNPAIDIDASSQHHRNHFEPPQPSGRFTGLPSHRINSETSNTSLPYSFYELPESRHSSSNHSTHSQTADRTVQSQNDGAGSSRNFTQGAYHSIYPSQIRAVDESSLHPPSSRGSNHSSPNRGFLGHGVSPRPATPYSRVQGDQRNPMSSAALVTAGDFVGGNQDAASAAARDLSSPLDILEHRATDYFHRISDTQRSRRTQPYSMAAPAPGSYYPGAGFDRQWVQQRRAMGFNQHYSQPGNNGYAYSSGYHQPARPMRPPTYASHWPSEHPLPRAPPPLAPRRGTHGARMEQRSSENAPVNNGQPVVRGARDGGTRASIRQVRNVPSSNGSMRGGDIQISPVPLRYSMPHSTVPRDTSNRPRGPPAYQPASTRSSPRDFQDDNEPYNSPLNSQRIDRQTPPIRAPTIPPRYGSRRYPTRPSSAVSHNEHLPVPSSFHPADRTPPPTSTAFDQATGTISRRTPAPRAPPPPPPSRRRNPPPHQDQENSGDAELALMREEMEAAGLRYAENGQLEVMEATPPRLGRFERYMMG